MGEFIILEIIVARWKANFFLWLMALTWGATFIFVKEELDQLSPVQFVAWRFLIAAGFLGLMFFRRIIRWSLKVWLAGLGIGTLLGGGFILQTMGLQLTTAGKTGFLTGTQVVSLSIDRVSLKVGMWVGDVGDMCGREEDIRAFFLVLSSGGTPKISSLEIPETVSLSYPFCLW